MTAFESHELLYDEVLKQGEGKEKFIGLVSAICSHLNEDQIFNIYNVSRDNIYANKYQISENEIFSAIVLNVTKLMINYKLKKADDKLSGLLPENRINDYLMETQLYPLLKIQLSPREIKLRQKINTGKANSGDPRELKYQQELYNLSLQRLIPQLNQNEIQYDKNNIESSIIQFLKDNEPIYQAMFHTERPATPSNCESPLVDHYNDAEIKTNTLELLDIKNRFIEYIKTYSAKHPNYKEIIELVQNIESVNKYQEIQEMQQGQDWMRTAWVLDNVCPTFNFSKNKIFDGWLCDNVINNIDTSNDDNFSKWWDIESGLNPIYSILKEETAFETSKFFNNLDVKKYITPTKFGAGKLYVHALKESEEIKLMAKYLIENITNGKIKAHKEHSLSDYAHIIMPQMYARKVSMALSVFSKV